MTSSNGSNNSPEMELIGRQLGSCKITEFIGRGGMGFVFKGIHTALNRDVAIKILTQTGQDEKAVQWFLREARSIAQLEHPNIIQVYDLAYDEGLGTHYIVMQFVDGESLDTIVKTNSEGRLYYPQAVEFTVQTAQGLGGAHKKNIIHRDVKPANIMLTSDGVVKITDFGLAKSVSGNDALGSTTGTSVIVGTPLFMAPEQCMGKDIDARTDIYSLGASLYFLLTGRPPFTGKNSFEILEKQITETPIRPEEFVEDIPGPVSDVVMKMLAKDPEERHKDCEEIVQEISHILAPSEDDGGTFVPSAGRKAFHVSGVEKGEFVKALDQIHRERRCGIMSLRSKDSHIMVQIGEGKIQVSQPGVSMEDLMEENSQYMPLELVSLILIQALSWEPFTWEFSEESPDASFSSDSLFIETDGFNFVLGYSRIIQAVVDLDKTGTLILSSAVESLVIMYSREGVKVVSQVPKGDEAVAALSEEEGSAVLERFRDLKFKIEYVKGEAFNIEGVSFEYSLSTVFFEILYQYSDFAFFLHLIPSHSDLLGHLDPYTSKKFQTEVKDLRKISDTVTFSLTQSLSQYKSLENMGVPGGISFLLWGGVCKERIVDTIEQISNFAAAFESKENEMASEVLLDQALALYPKNIKLIEDLASISEENRRFERAASFWYRCGQVKEEDQDYSLARSYYDKALTLDRSNTKIHISLFNLMTETDTPAEIVQAGTAIIPLLRKANQIEPLVKICEEVLKHAPNTIIAYKELVNYHLDWNNQKEAVELYAKLADIYKEQGNEELYRRTWQKIQKLDPSYATSSGMSLQDIAATQTNIKIIQPKQHEYITKLIVAIIAVAALIVAWREWSAVQKLNYFKKQISEGQFPYVKENMTSFKDEYYLLGTSDRAAEIYYKEVAAEDFAQMARKKQSIRHKIKTIMGLYMPRSEFRTLLSELDLIREQVMNNSLLNQELEGDFTKARNQVLQAMQENQQTRFDDALKKIEKQEFDQARQILRQLSAEDPSKWVDKVEDIIKELADKEKDLMLQMKANRREQDKRYVEAQELDSKNDLAGALKKYQEVIALLPKSEVAAKAKQAAEGIDKIIRDGKGWLTSAENLLQAGKVEESREFFQKAFNHPRFSRSPFVLKQRVPLFVQTIPESGILCSVDGKTFRTPFIYRYSAKDKIQIQVRGKGFRVEKQSESKYLNGKLAEKKLEVQRTPIWSFRAQGVIKANPIAQGSRVIIGSNDRQLYALKMNGEKAWQFYSGNRSELPEGDIAFNGSTSVFSTSKGSIYGVSSKGKKLWSLRGRQNGSSPMSSYKNYLCFASDKKAIYLLNVSSTKYSVARNIKIGFNAKYSPIFGKGLNIVAADDNNLAYLSAKEGKVVWRKKISLQSSPTSDDNNVYYADAENLQVVALRKSDGKVVWKVDSDDVSHLYAHGGFVWGATQNKVILLGDDGKEIANSKIEGKVTQATSFKDVIFFTDDQFFLYAYSLSQQKMLWKYTLPEETYTRPACDGKNLYVSAGDTLYVLSVENLFQ